MYDIADHPDFHFRTTDIVIRIWNSENGQNDCENEVRTELAFIKLGLINWANKGFTICTVHLSVETHS